QARANALLDRAGWTGRTPDGIRTKDGAPLTVRLVYSPGSIFTSEGATVLQALQEQWRQVGFDVQLVPATRAELNSGRYSDPSTYDAMPSYWTSPSPAILWIVWRPSTPEKPNGNNRSFYTNPDLARVIHEANTSTDPPARLAAVPASPAHHLRRRRRVGLYTQNTLVAASNRVKDFWLE